MNELVEVLLSLAWYQALSVIVVALCLIYLILSFLFSPITQPLHDIVRELKRSNEWREKE